MSYYLPLALLFSVLFVLLSYYSYRNQKPGWVLYGGMLMLVALRICSSLYNGIWNTDEAEWVSLAYGLPYCDIPYQCFDAHSTGFFTIWLLKGLYWLGIDYNYTSLRLFGLFVFLVPAIIIFYHILRRLYQPREVVVAFSLLVHFFLFGAYNHDMLAYNSEFIILFFTAVLFYCYTVYRQQQKNSLLLIAGISIGIIPFAKLQGVPIALVFGLAFVILLLKKRNRVPVLLFGGACIIPLLLIFIGFSQKGIWDDFWKMYIESNRYLAGHSDASLLQKIKVFIYMQRWIAPYYILAAVLALVSYRQNRFQWRSLLKKIEWVPVFVLGAAYIATAASGWGAEHYNTLIILPLFLVIANLIGLLDTTSWLERGRNLLRYSAGLLFIALLYTLLPELNRFKKRLYDDAWPYSANLLEYVWKHVPPGEPLCVLGWFQAVEIQVDAKRPLATRTAHNFYQLAHKDTALARYYQEQYISDLEASKPLLVIDPSKEMEKKMLAPVKEYILSHYTYETMLDSSKVYKRIKP